MAQLPFALKLERNDAKASAMTFIPYAKTFRALQCNN